MRAQALFLLLGVLVALVAQAAPDSAALRERYLLGAGVHVYPTAAAGNAKRGFIHRGQVVAVDGKVAGKGCAKGSWYALMGGGYACLERITPSELSPAPQPVLVNFDAPLPEEYRNYAKTGKWERSPPDQTIPLVPFIYAKRWRAWQGPFYTSLKAFEQGAAPAEDQMEPHRKFRFVDVRQTKKGEVLVRPDGMVVPIKNMYVYPVTNFKGRDLELSPLPEGRIPAWVGGYDGAPLYTDPDAKSTVLATLEYHTVLELDPTPGDAAGRFWKVLNLDTIGYVDLQKGARRYAPQPRNPEISVEEEWIDIDVDQQMLTLYRGDTPIYITMVSTGKVGYGTPLGIFRISDKMAWTDMQSRDDAEEDDVYWVEGVPWTMHFAFRYALHASWWHWGYGNKASHGCVNLSPLDAREIFDRSRPALPPGWHTVYEMEQDLGTTIRIRYGAEPVRDRRGAWDARWKGRWASVDPNPPKPKAKPLEEASPSGG